LIRVEFDGEVERSLLKFTTSEIDIGSISDQILDKRLFATCDGPERAVRGIRRRANQWRAEMPS
jgi:hypothetical protein